MKSHICRTRPSLNIMIERHRNTFQPLPHNINNIKKHPASKTPTRLLYLPTMKFQAILFLLASEIAATSGDVIPSTICGNVDDRILSKDVRQGHLDPVGCTAWLISESVFLTAAHCGLPSVRFTHVDFLFDGTSPGPNEDRYEVELSSYRTGDLSQQVPGWDWAVGRLKPNNITLKLPGVAQSEKCENKAPGCGWYALGEVPFQSGGNSITITGYGGNFKGTGTSPQSTHTGPLVRINSTHLFYRTDTTVSLITKVYHAAHICEF